MMPVAVSRIAQIGFLGVGWIGLNRMNAAVQSKLAHAAAIADPSFERCQAALLTAPDATVVRSLDELLQLDLDGIVIATPSALHTEQAVQILERGIAVFCQKPLGRTAEEVQRVIRTAQLRDRLLGVDLNTRLTSAFRAIEKKLQANDIGDVYAVDVTYHHAYGPDKEWFYDPAQSGGGCVIDLGIHLLDLALAGLGKPTILDVDAHLFRRGKPLRDHAREVEDYAIVQITTARCQVIRMTCSWNASAGQDAVIDATFHGTRGTLRLHNVAGSFYDLAAIRLNGTQREVLVDSPEDWGGFALVEWLQQLQQSNRFRESARHLVEVARIVDWIYRKGVQCVSS